MTEDDGEDETSPSSCPSSRLRPRLTHFFKRDWLVPHKGKPVAPKPTQIGMGASGGQVADAKVLS